jgi:hypothetical protein
MGKKPTYDELLIIFWHIHCFYRIQHIEKSGGYIHGATRRI